MNIPKEWGMFSGKGNYRIKQLAESFARKVEQSDKIYKKVITLEEYILSYRNVSNNENYAEASDTDVRERVYWFAKEIMQNHEIVDYIWDNC